MSKKVQPEYLSSICGGALPPGSNSLYQRTYFTMTEGMSWDIEDPYGTKLVVTTTGVYDEEGYDIFSSESSYPVDHLPCMKMSTAHSESGRFVGRVDLQWRETSTC